MSYRLLAVLSLILSSVAWSQSTVPTTVPSTAPATLFPADASTPKGALRLLFNATDHGDAATIRSLLLAVTPLEEKLADSMAQMASADAQLRKALTTAFGDAQTKAGFGDIEASGKVRDSVLDKLPEKIDRDTAIIVLESQGRATPVEFKKVDGQWKFLVSKSIEKTDPATVEKQVAVIGIQMKVYRDITADIAAGKHKNVTDVKQTVEARVRQALMQYVQDQSKAAGPASQPTSQPK